MARPKKEKELKHTHRIYLRLTDTEYEIISENAKATNLPLAEYARRQLMNEKLTAKYEIVADLPELKKLIAEFGKIGSNLSQNHRLSRWLDSRPIRAHSRRWSLKTHRKARQPQRQLPAKPLGLTSSCFYLPAHP